MSDHIRKARAAITDGKGSFETTDIEIGIPQPREVLVSVKAAGICHTDWDSLSWGDQMILGHEGAGVVEAVGSEVEHVKPGDHVLLNWAIPCHQCFQCLNGNYAICESDKDPSEGSTLFRDHPIKRSFALGTMSTETIVRKEAVIRIDDIIPFGSAAIAGCGVMTGYGSVVNAAKVNPGASVVVIGCGGVGLNVIQGAKISGAEIIIAIDPKESRLKMAADFGATHFIAPESSDGDLEEVAQKVRRLTNNRGADFSFECTGIPKLGAAPLRMVRNAGTAIQVSGIEEEITIDMNLFEWDKVYMNPLYGKCNPEVDFPRLFSLYQSGKLKLDELVTNTYKLDELGKAFEDMLAGKNAKGVIIMN